MTKKKFEKPYANVLRIDTDVITESSEFHQVMIGGLPFNVYNSTGLVQTSQWTPSVAEQQFQTNWIAAAIIGPCMA